MENLVKYIEIAPLSDCANCFQSPDVNKDLSPVKVCVNLNTIHFVFISLHYVVNRALLVNRSFFVKGMLGGAVVGLEVKVKSCQTLA